MSFGKRQQRGRLLHPCLALKPSANSRVHYDSEAALAGNKIHHVTDVTYSCSAPSCTSAPDVGGESGLTCAIGGQRFLDRSAPSLRKRPRSEGITGVDDVILSPTSTALLPWAASYGGRNWLERDMLARGALQDTIIDASCASLQRQAVARVARDGVARDLPTLDALLHFCRLSPRVVAVTASDMGTSDLSYVGTTRRTAAVGSLFATWRYYAAHAAQCL